LYEEYLKKVKIYDGFVQNFLMVNPMNYEMLKERYKDIAKNNETYEQFGLNDEGILLFADQINVDYENNSDLVQKVFGRTKDTGMYLLKPNASITMATTVADEKENYEVLQSRNLGKQLVLTKLNKRF